MDDRSNSVCRSQTGCTSLWPCDVMAPLKEPTELSAEYCTFDISHHCSLCRFPLGLYKINLGSEKKNNVRHPSSPPPPQPACQSAVGLLLGLSAGRYVQQTAVFLGYPALLGHDIPNVLSPPPLAPVPPFYSYTRAYRFCNPMKRSIISGLSVRCLEMPW